MSAPTRLVPATPAHFAWAIRGAEAERLEGGLRLPPGGLDAPEVLAWIARTAAAVEAELGAPAAWLVASGDEVVGCVSFKAPPRGGVVEIGYGIAASRQRRGHATAAVALLVEEAAARGLALAAETSATNRASQLVLERNGFTRGAERLDDAEGPLLAWRLG